MNAEQLSKEALAARVVGLLLLWSAACFFLGAVSYGEDIYNQCERHGYAKSTMWFSGGIVCSPYKELSNEQ